MERFFRHIGWMLCVVLLCSVAGRNPALTQQAGTGMSSCQGERSFIAESLEQTGEKGRDAHLLAVCLPFQTDMEVGESGAPSGLQTYLRTFRQSFMAQLLSQKSLSEKMARLEMAGRQAHYHISYTHFNHLSGLSACDYYVFALRRILI